MLTIFFICGVSVNLVEILGNTFGVFIVAEFSSMASKIIYVSLEINTDELTSRDDFLQFKVEKE